MPQLRKQWQYQVFSSNFSSFSQPCFHDFPPAPNFCSMNLSAHQNAATRFENYLFSVHSGKDLRTFADAFCPIVSKVRPCLIKKFSFVVFIAHLIPQLLHQLPKQKTHNRLAVANEPFFHRRHCFRQSQLNKFKKFIIILRKLS